MKEIYLDDIYKVFSKHYSIEKFQDKKALILNPFEAFIFASVTGASYLNNTTFPFSPRGLVKIVNDVFNPRLVNGLFTTNFELSNTPRMLNEKFPFLFNDTKKIIFIEINGHQDYLEKIFKLSNETENSNNIIVYPINITKKGNGLEPILEFLSCKTFSEEGYITEHQTPLNQKFGSPDFFAFQFNNSEIKMSDKTISSGFHLLESTFLFHEEFNKNLMTNSVEYSENISKKIVGEAKVVATNIEGRLQKYLNTNFFDTSLQIVTSLSSKNIVNNYFSFNDSNQIIFNFSKNFQPNKIHYESFDDWLLNYLKLHLLTNLSAKEFIKFKKDHNLTKSNFFKLNLISLNEIICRIK